MQPGQSLRRRRYNLHEHEHLAAAVLRARRPSPPPASATRRGNLDACVLSRASTSLGRFWRNFAGARISWRPDDASGGGRVRGGRVRQAEDAQPARDGRDGVARRTRGARRHACGSRVRAESRWASRVRSSTGEVCRRRRRPRRRRATRGDPRSPRRARTIGRVGTRKSARVRRRRGTREGGGRRRGGERRRRRGKPASPRRSGRRRACRGIRRRRRQWFPFVSSSDRVVRARPFGTTDTSSPAAGARRARRAHGDAASRTTGAWRIGYGPSDTIPSVPSPTAPLSAALADVARRNAVLSRADTALRAVRRARRGRRFADDFSSLPSPASFPFPVEGRRRPWTALPRPPRRGTGPENPNRRGWIICTRIGPRGRSRTAPRATVAEMERNVERLEDAFVRVGDAMYDGDLNAAHELSSAVLDDARAFEAYVAREVTAARDALGCCRTARRRRDGGRAAASALVVRSPGGGCLLLVFARGAERGEEHPGVVGFELGLGGGVMRGSALRSRARGGARGGASRVRSEDAQIDDAAPGPVGT